MRIRVLVLAFLCGLIAVLAVAAAPASAAPRLCLYIDERQVAGGSPTGHAFVQLLPDSGTRNQVWGFSPKVTWQFLTGSDGQVTDNGDHAWDWKLCNTVSQDNYNKAAKVVEEDRKSPPRYALLKFNCTDWAYKVLEKAGMKLPDATALFTRVYDPEQVAKELKKMYAQQGGRNIPGGNAVFHNNPRKIPKESPDFRVVANAAQAADSDPPFGDSYSDIIRLGFGDPKQTADLYDFSNETADLDDVTVDSGGEVHVKLNGIKSDEAITSIRWGDGEPDYQGRVFQHTYKEPGTYRVTGLAMADEMVYRFTFTVRVEDGGDREAHVDVNVPEGAPKVD